MTDFAALVAADTGQDARTIVLIDTRGQDAWLAAQPERARTAVAAQQFRAEPFAHAILPGDAAGDWSVVAGVADAAALSAWCLAKLAAALPPGSYRLAGDGDPGAALHGWLVAQHRFTRYKAPRDPAAAGPRTLLTTAPQRIDSAVAEAAATALVRDLVDTPASDMGPADLEAAVRAIAAPHGARVDVVIGDALDTGFPMIAAVGRAAARARSPRLVTLTWGDAAHPLIAIVGKGVTFDSGGLDIKPAAGMALMKKDMGGAAHAIALAQLVMTRRLPVRLLLSVPAAENGISADAMRPGDVLTSRKGLTVEIDNTDAEGRLLLGDALAHAAEQAPDLIVDFATLTGAARVALGPDLPALFSDDAALAAALDAAGRAQDDPVWRLPLWDGYDEMLKSDLADLTNAPAGGFAGAITAALFLRRFVPPGTAWVHLDTFAWRPVTRPGRPKGGAALGLRALWHLLRERYATD